MTDLSYYYQHLLLTLLSLISFWAQSIVTEERLVPALNYLADRHSIPDDIAGATLMAAGASSPELLCTLVSLFVTHSSLGLGTIVGSEIFNQLIICAGSVYASKGKVLVLDRKMVVREVGFYGLSIGLLYVALSDARGVIENEDGEYENGEMNEGGSEERIYVSFWKALLLFGGYVLYVLVCANMETVEKCLEKIRWRRMMLLVGRNIIAEDGIDGSSGEQQQHHEKDGNAMSDYKLQTDEKNNADLECSLGKSTSLGSIHYKSFDDHDLHQLPFIYNITTEPVENWEIQDENDNNNDDDILVTNSSISHNDDDNVENASINNNLPSDKTKKKKKRNILSSALHKSFKLIKANHILCRDDYPVEINDVFELTNNTGTHEIGVFLWQRSIFYTKARFGSHAFHLRWFTITPHKIISVPDRREPHRHAIVYPLFDEIHVDERPLIINIVHPMEGRRDFTLMAPNKAIFDAVVQGLEEYMSATRPLRLRGMTELDDDEADAAGDSLVRRASAKERKRDIDADPHVELIELPRNASKLELALWVSVFPLRVIMHYTLPDIRHLDRHGQPQQSTMYAYLSTVSCLVWLIVGSYVMVTSLESLAALLGIPDAVMGVTLSAAGTSLPAYIASRISAEKGFGNQAVANVFGSNTFNICIGLGLPWVIYIAVMGFEPYHELDNEGIIESIIVLMGALVMFVVLMISSNYVLVKWHADLFVVLYFVYIVYAVGQVYW